MKKKIARKKKTVLFHVVALPCLSMKVARIKTVLLIALHCLFIKVARIKTAV